MPPFSPDLSDDCIRLPPQWCHFVRMDNYTDVILKTWPDLQHYTTSTHDRTFIDAAILAPLNNMVDDVNRKATDLLPRQPYTFNSIDKVDSKEDDTNEEASNVYPTELLNSIDFQGLPPDELRLKIGQPIMLIRNLRPKNGLCNGTRLICRGFSEHLIKATIALGRPAAKQISNNNSYQKTNVLIYPLQVKLCVYHALLLSLLKVILCHSSFPGTNSQSV